MKTSQFTHKTGIYFKSDNDVTSYYLIELCDGKFEGNCIVNIYSIDVPVDELINGSKIDMLISECVLLCELNLCGKYFFPTFNNEMQLYYDSEKYYNETYKSNSITSLMECINYAIEYGLTKNGIVPY